MKKVLLTLFCAFCALGVSAQSIRDLRINEVLVDNVDNYMDDYGHRSSWIELRNTEHGRINIGGCFLRLVTNGNDTIRYRIPTGDVHTEIGAHGYKVFFCEGTGTKGTFYTNFTLDDVAAIAFFDAAGDKDGAKPIDEVFIDANQVKPDISVGRVKKEDGSYVFAELPQTTPNATNDTEPTLPRHEQFRQRDPYGLVMAATAVPVVLSVLAVLFILFKLLGNYMVLLTRKKSAVASPESSVEPENKYETPYTGDEIAAIVMALQMFQDDLHDKEATVVTINKVARAYSPWSSKIYGLSQFKKK